MLMLWTIEKCAREIHAGLSVANDLSRRNKIVQASWPKDADSLVNLYKEQVQTIYMDPPFDTGKPYDLKLPVGDEGWRRGKPCAIIRAYDDRLSSADYIGMMRSAIESAHKMLRDSGALFLHIDPRRSRIMRGLLDETFGAANFVNEIIWAYETGGRAVGHFSKKHDVLLFYKKSEKLYFDIKPSAMPRTHRHNHMRRGADETGRAYSAINVAGKEYRYFDDEPVYPSDVWTDIAPLQQRDPRRTGFDTQKPGALLSRVIGVTTRPGDMVADLFAGSGTSLRVAADMGLPFLGVDSSPIAIIVMRKRMLGSAFELEAESMFDVESHPEMVADVESLESGLRVTLLSFSMDKTIHSDNCDSLLNVDQWSVGFIDGKDFHSLASAARDKKNPAIARSLDIDCDECDHNNIAIIIVDTQGRRIMFKGTAK